MDHHITSSQQKVLDFVRSMIDRTGRPPTRAEIANGLGFKSANAAEDHLRALARKGVIELPCDGASRNIRLKFDASRDALPDLLAAMRHARRIVARHRDELFEGTYGGVMTVGCQVIEYDTVLADIDAAIAKAEGRS